ncbi:MAG: hypothetical protein LBR10_12175 [Prevotellaceae bacterium]|jgi:hypothetical protein|nr:hypothetical protein [Prevotellaceae bacterium]
MGKINANTAILFWILPYCLMVFLICFAKNAVAQSDDSLLISEAPRSVATKSDTTIYRRVQQIMSGKKITRKIFSVLTRKPVIDTASAPPVAIDAQFAPFKGKIINDIKVIILPPFGYNVKLDSMSNINRFERIGNKSHINTRSWVLRNNLLFKKGQEIDPLIIAETETFIRNMEYINNVSISIDSISDKMANVTVIAQDNWSIGFYARNISAEKVDFEIYDRNFLGLGNNVSVREILNINLQRHFGFGLGYKYSNLLHTFVNIDASYVDDIVSQNHSYSVERPLQKNLNVFGQINFRQTKMNFNNAVWDSVSPTYNHEFSVSAGYAFNPTKLDNTFVISTRFLDRMPLYKRVLKPENTDSYQYVRNQMILLQFSLFKQRYFRDYMVNSFGKIENFAYGYNISTQIGYSKWSQFNKEGLYSSVKIATNKQFKIGSIYVEGALSSFFDKHGPFEGMISLKTNMFSPLFNIGIQKYRHFLNVDYTKRLNNIPGFRNHQPTINEMPSMKFGHFGTDATIVERLMFKTEGDLFSSLTVFGFRFLFYSFVDFGWIKNREKTLLNKNNIFWGSGLGIRVRNDLLVFRTIEFKIGYYPRINQSGFNSFINTSSSIPNMSPNFIPKYPEEIPLY